MKPYFLVAALFFSLSLKAQEINIIPKPNQIKVGKGNFMITPATLLLAKDEGDKVSASFFNQHLKTYYGFQLKTVASATKNFIRFNTKKFIQPGTEGKYDLNINSTGADISGDTYSGTFNGMQTLIQLLPVENIKKLTKQISIPQVSINDAPRFQYRGLHLDVGRHFFTINFIKRYIDFLAYHKLNVFHWHLTEDQGWRMEIKQYPLLTSIGSKRNGTIIGRYPGKGNDNTPHEGYYTQKEIKDVIDYAKQRFVEVIPEIEMPGHGSAAIAAYPYLSCFPNKPTEIPANMISKKSVEEQKNGRIKLVQETWGVFDDVFCAGKDSTFDFLENVLDEVIALFPSKYIHIGGDECPKVHWKQCPNCQKRMKDLGLKDEHELQSYFIQRIEKYLNTKGKTIIGWDEILEGGLAPNAQVMSWRGEEGGIAAAKQNHYVIMTPGNPVYFDHSQSKNEDSVTIGGYNPIEKVYAYNPVPKELSADQHKYIRGAQANMWTEYMDNPTKVEYMAFPRVSALSEILWTNVDNKNWDDFEKRVQVQMKRYDLMKWNYSKAYFEPEVKITSESGKIIWKFVNKIKDTKIIAKKIDGPNSTPDLKTFNQAISSFEIPGTGSYEALLVKPDHIQKKAQIIGKPIQQSFIFTKSTGKKITLNTTPSKSYPGDGAFTLVNGVVNEKGLSKSSEFLGFEGNDCEAVIDLGNSQSFSSVVVHSYAQHGSWIYEPSAVQVSTSNDGTTFTSIGETKTFDNNKMQLNVASASARFIKVKVVNNGVIAEGNPGAGHKAWMFVSEIQIN